jgi:hypothetical protein
MDLFCPHCTRRVTVPDDKAGQVLSCPLCTKQFMAPTLTPPSAPKPPPPSSTASVPETFGLGPAPSPSPPLMNTPSSTPPTPAAPSEPPPPPPPPGEYTRSFVFPLRAEWLAFVPTLCLFAIFVLSFFRWHLQVLTPEVVTPALSMWGLAFTEYGQAQFLAYAILMLLAIPLTAFVLVVDTGIIQPLAQIKPLMIFKNLLIGVFLGLPFLLLCYDYVHAHFLSMHGNPIAVAEKVVFRLHLIAVVVCFLMTWLNWRRTNNLPPPRLEGRW